MPDDGTVSPTGSPHCGLCGVLWSEHERDPHVGPMGVRSWVCRLTEDQYNELLKFLDTLEYK